MIKNKKSRDDFQEFFRAWKKFTYYLPFAVNYTDLVCFTENKVRELDDIMERIFHIVLAEERRISDGN